MRIDTFPLHEVPQAFLSAWPPPLVRQTSTCVWRPGMHVGQIAVIRRVKYANLLHIVAACCYLETPFPGQPATPQAAARLFDGVRQFDHESPSFSRPPACRLFMIHVHVLPPRRFPCPCAAAGTSWTNCMRPSRGSDRWFATWRKPVNLKAGSSCVSFPSFSTVTHAFPHRHRPSPVGLLLAGPCQVGCQNFRNKFLRSTK